MFSLHVPVPAQYFMLGLTGDSALLDITLLKELDAMQTGFQHVYIKACAAMTIGKCTFQTLHCYTVNIDGSYMYP